MVFDGTGFIYNALYNIAQYWMALDGVVWHWTILDGNGWCWKKEEKGNITTNERKS